jgi:hypothetical protein
MDIAAEPTGRGGFIKKNSRCTLGHSAVNLTLERAQITKPSFTPFGFCLTDHSIFPIFKPTQGEFFSLLPLGSWEDEQFLRKDHRGKATRRGDHDRPGSADVL